MLVLKEPIPVARSRVMAAVAGCAVLALLALAHPQGQSAVSKMIHEHNAHQVQEEVVQIPDAPVSNRHWIFDDLDAEETRVVTEFIMEQLPGLKSSIQGLQGDINYDYISGASAVQLIAPTKLAAKAYVSGVSVPPPPRFAKVTVVRGSRSIPDVMEYKVGPLVGCDMEATMGCNHPLLTYFGGARVTEMLPAGAIPFEKRPMDLGDKSTARLIGAELKVLMPLLLESFGPIWPASLVPDCSGCHLPSSGQASVLVANDIDSNSTLRVNKITFNWFADVANSQASWLHPIPISFKTAQRGTKEKDWFTYDFSYCGSDMYKNAAALLDAIASHEVSKCNVMPDGRWEGRPGNWDVPGPGPSTRLRGPRDYVAPVAPLRRFTLSSENGGNNGRYVGWMGWGFFATHRPSTGAALFDITFKGKSVAWELALSEAVAMYAGPGNDQGFVLDSAWSMSQIGNGILPGVDCPEGAALLNGTTWVFPSSEGFMVDTAAARSYSAMCVYEEFASGSLWRHTQALSKTTSGVPQSTLVVRAATAVGSSDYMTEFKFGLDGSIKADIVFGGYTQSRWYNPDSNMWELKLGEIVHPGLNSMLHSRFASFKVDLDVLGPVNSLEVSEIKVGRPSGVPGLDRWPTQYVERRFVPKEGAGRSTFVEDPRAPTVIRVTDSNKFAKQGELPGYAIVPGATIHQNLPSSHPFVKAAAFTKYTVAVTRHKNDEQRVSSVYDLYGSGQPYTSIDTFLDGDSLEAEDLVAWVTVGKEHLPRSEDLPLISNFGTGFTLLPWNMFPANAAMDI